MKISNTGLKIILVVLVVVLIIGIATLVILVLNYSKTGSSGQAAPEIQSIEQLPPEIFPTNSPTKDSSKIIISEVRNASDGSIASVTLMIPQSLIGLTTEVNGVPVVIVPVDATTIRVDIPTGLDTGRLEIIFRAGTEARASCILNQSNLQQTEGNCIW